VGKSIPAHITSLPQDFLGTFVSLFGGLLIISVRPLGQMLRPMIDAMFQPQTQSTTSRTNHVDANPIDSTPVEANQIETAQVILYRQANIKAVFGKLRQFMSEASGSIVSGANLDTLTVLEGALIAHQSNPRTIPALPSGWFPLLRALLSSIIE
jgi:hypothetical protein